MSEKLEPIHPVDALLDAAKKMFPGREVDQASVDRLRAICDEMVTVDVTTTATTAPDSNITTSGAPGFSIKLEKP